MNKFYRQLLNGLDMGDHMDNGNEMMGFFNVSWWMWILMLIPLLVILLLTYWTYQDAKQRDENSTLWAFIVFITMGLGIIIYVIIRNPEVSLTPRTVTTPRRQQVTHSPQGSVGKFPYGENQWTTQIFCDQCGIPLEMNHNFCPKCGESVHRG